MKIPLAVTVSQNANSVLLVEGPLVSLAGLHTKVCRERYATGEGSYVPRSEGTNSAYLFSTKSTALKPSGTPTKHPTTTSLPTGSVPPPSGGGSISDSVTLPASSSPTNYVFTLSVTSGAGNTASGPPVTVGVS